jgi:uncharacterized protein
MFRKKWTDWLWDAWCCLSGIGIWPRYIEPQLLEITHFTLPIPNLPPELEGLKILHFSDLHWNGRFSSRLKKKFIRQSNSLNPDIIVFTGDFICRSLLEDPEGLKLTLDSLKAKIGCFAVLGNHDYARFVTVNAQGNYDIEMTSNSSNISKGFKRLLRPISLTKKITARAKEVGLHEDLMALLKQTSFQVLNNTTQLVAYKGSWINICGLEEYTLGRFNPDHAFRNYQDQYPGIILSHNPDTIQILKHYPGDIILSGHTHGGQVNLPGIWKRFTLMENFQYKKGLKVLGEKWAYINRGISSVMKFRWFATPEITFINLQKK